MRSAEHKIWNCKSRCAQLLQDKFDPNYQARYGRIYTEVANMMRSISFWNRSHVQVLKDCNERYIESMIYHMTARYGWSLNNVNGKS